MVDNLYLAIHAHVDLQIGLRISVFVAGSVPELPDAAIHATAERLVGQHI